MSLFSDSNNSNGFGNQRRGYVNLDGTTGYDDDDDEDLMRAIAESLKK
jgi:hypothetical protein